MWLKASLSGVGRYLVPCGKVLAAAGSKSFIALVSRVTKETTCVEKSIAGSGTRAEPLEAAAQSVATGISTVLLWLVDAEPGQVHQPGQVQQSSGEGSGKGVGGFGARFGEVFVQSQVRCNRVPEKVPEKVWEALVQSQVRFNRVPEKVPEGVPIPGKVRGGFFAEPGQVQQGSGDGSGEGLGGFGRFNGICSHFTYGNPWQHASERFVKIKDCGCWRYHRSLFFRSSGLTSSFPLYGLQWCIHTLVATLWCPFLVKYVSYRMGPPVISWCILYTIITPINYSSWRKFRSQTSDQTSDNMDRWKAEMGSVREKRRVEERRAEERRSEKRKSQKKEDAGARKVRKVANHCVFHWFVAPEGRKVGSLKRRVRSHLARWEMKNCSPVWREANFEVNMYKAHHSRTTFGSWDVEKVDAVVARSTCASEKVKDTSRSHHFWKLPCRKSACRCCAKHIAKSKCTKHTILGPLLEVEMSKKWTPLWHEAHFELKMWRAPHVRAIFGRSGVVSRGRRKGLRILSKVGKTCGYCSISKNNGRRGTFEQDLQRCIFRGKRSARDMFIRAVRRSGRWFPERGCILESERFIVRHHDHNWDKHTLPYVWPSNWGGTWGVILMPSRFLAWLAAKASGSSYATIWRIHVVD